MHRFFIEEVIREEQTEVIIHNKEDVKHLVKALRVKIGEEIEVCDPRGQEYVVSVKEIGDGEVICTCLRRSEVLRESSLEIHLYQGLAKGNKMETIVQKSVELGITRFVPLVTKRCVVKLDVKSEGKKVERWQKIADEASKQSKRSILPCVDKVHSFADLLHVVDKYDAVFLAYEQESNQKLKKLIQNKDYQKLAVVIGPEGGFSEEEVEAAVSQGIISISLGKRILRTETAGICVISILQYELGDLG